MGFFDKLRKRKSTDVCRYIWKNYVPKSGQADNLQGELLREIEGLRWEAQENGNINWDEDFAYFCDFISAALSGQPIFSDGEKEEIRSVMGRIKEYGTYARKANDGEIPYDDIDMEKIAYVEDDLYDIICDKIAQLHIEYTEPIPYEKNESVCR